VTCPAPLGGPERRLRRLDPGLIPTLERPMNETNEHHTAMAAEDNSELAILLRIRDLLRERDHRRAVADYEAAVRESAAERAARPNKANAAPTSRRPALRVIVGGRAAP